MSKTTDRNVPLELLNELYRSYDFFNKHYCEGKLPRPMIIVSSAFNKKAHGWFGPGSWKVSNKVVSEITLCGESFQRGHQDVLGTLIHEMAHLKNYYDNECKVVDCTDQQRHNNIFKKTAEFFGLSVTTIPRFGPAHTEVGEKAQEAIDKLKPKVELYKLYKEMKPKEEKEKKKSKLKPVMIDSETKVLIAETAKAMGMTEKKFTTTAVNLFKNLEDRVRTIAHELYTKGLKQFSDIAQLQTFISNGLSEPDTKVESGS